MLDVNDRVNGDVIDEDFWNSGPNEIQNVIEDLGITLSGSDFNQLGKALHGYISNGTFYNDTGTADSYILGIVGSKQRAPAYTVGFQINFLTTNVNTGIAATVNVAGLGVKNIKLFNGNDPAAGDIDAGKLNSAFFDGTDFILTSEESTIAPSFPAVGGLGEVLWLYLAAVTTAVTLGSTLSAASLRVGGIYNTPQGLGVHATAHSIALNLVPTGTSFRALFEVIPATNEHSGGPFIRTVL